MCTEINFLSRSFNRPTIEESWAKWDPQSREIEKFGKGTQKKETTSMKNRSRFEVLWKVHTLGVNFRSMQLGFTCDPQLVSLCVCSKLHAFKSSHLRCELFTIPQSDFRTCFLFLDYPCQISRFLHFLGSHITKTFFDGRPIERATQKVDFSTHECMRSGTE